MTQPETMCEPIVSELFPVFLCECTTGRLVT